MISGGSYLSNLIWSSESIQRFFLFFQSLVVFRGKGQKTGCKRVLLIMVLTTRPNPQDHKELDTQSMWSRLVSFGFQTYSLQASESQ